MWGGQKDVQDLVRGIRAHKKEEANYIRECLQEIKEELKEENHQKKSLAVQKLTYLQMLGYDISWAAFNIVEVMSQPTFTNKRIGYLAASQSFHEGTEVVMLTTSLFKKALTVPNHLANICTPDLARDLAADIVAILNSSRAYLRKKGILVLYKIFLKFPEALRPSFPRLKDRLEDTDQSVISAAVNVICELARKNPKNYLPLAPTLFKILQSSTNNWMLIKIIKLFGALTPLEKRLAKRLVQPLTNLINTTTAMSLLYECIQTCIIGLSHKIPLMRLCITKLRTFIEDPDQNLKYLGLLALNSIMKVHPKAVGEHRDLIIKCLEDPDITIRLRALDLLTGMVTKKNLRDIIKKLIEHVHTADGHYKDNLIEKIISICNQDSYHYVTDFEWYITVLMTLVRLIGPGTKHGKLISSQFMDVIIRVNVVRSYGVKNMIQLLRDSTLFNEGQGSSVQEVLYAAAWIVGEFSSYSRNFVELMEVLLQPRVVSLPAEIQAIYMQNILKIFSQALKATYQPVTLPDDDENDDDDGDRTFSLDPEALEQLVNTMLARLPVFKQSVHLEVQERACFAYEMVSLYNELRRAGEDSGASVAQEVYSIFEQPLNPVAPKAQKKVRPPEGLDLDAQINEVPESESEDSESSESESESSSDREEGSWFPKHEKGRESEVKKVHRPQSAYILTGENARRPSREDFIEEHAEPPPVASVADLGIHDPFSRKVKKRSRRHSKPVINKGYEMPEDMDDSNSDKDDDSKKKKGGIYADVDFTRPLEAHENLPVQQHRIVMSAPKKEEPPKKDRDGKHRSSRHRDKDGKHRDRDGKDRKGRHRHDDKERRSSDKSGRSRSSSTTSASSATAKGEKPAHIRSYEAGPRLIDISPSSPGKTPSSPAIAVASSAPASPGLSFLDQVPSLSSPAPVYEQIGSPSLGGSASPAPMMSSSYSSLPELSGSPLVAAESAGRRSSRDASKSGGRHRKDKDDRRRKDDAKSGSSSSRSRKGEKDKKSKKEKDIFADYEKDKKAKKEKSRGDGKESKSAKSASLLPLSSEEESKTKRSSSRHHDDRRHRSDRHGHRSERGAPAAAAAAAPAPAAQAPAVSTLVSDGSLRVVYTFRINPSEPNKAMAALNVINTASTETVTGISFTTIDTLSTKLVSGLSLAADLGPSQSVPHQLIFSLSNFVLPQKVKGSLSYTLKGAAEATPKCTPFELTFPPSTFIQPIKLSPDFLMGILDPSGTVGPSLQTASTNVTLSEGHDLVQSLIAMQTTLHVEVVERTPTAVSFYGRSLQELHVIVLAKIKSPSSFSVEIKSNNGTLASSLIAEVNTLFRSA
ncbi:adaptin subfamily protein [Acanthamoeba castellanii str. Neff]|uniref:AP-3 complex subunit delta n=1 Tax=Acanthamoeba castellanii (strain ATCC 30010 / Neff) TaxID=1257118 RepID=L8H2X2_ACACF|nr:adaptin subfamily protein [Acanthamoeba castellanii str. Neff]ELR18756.1 adaptin subfamily protein [Acanthamoeba castellanii str. Neff]